MKTGSLVRVIASHKSAGENGVVIECSGKSANVYWNQSDKTYWIEMKYLEVIHEVSSK